MRLWSWWAAGTPPCPLPPAGQNGPAPSPYTVSVQLLRSLPSSFSTSTLYSPLSLSVQVGMTIVQTPLVELYQNLELAVMLTSPL